MTDESMQSGTSVMPCTSGIACRISSTSSASGSPTFTSSTSAIPCSETSISSCERSPFCSCAWNALRPVGLMRSPMTQNGCSLPMTTVLDRDWMTVFTRLSLLTGRDAEPAAQTRDAGLAAEADQVQAAHTGLRERVRGELDTELEARLLGIVRALAALDQLVRNRDPRNLLVDEAQRGRRADEADRGQQRALGREARAHALGEEPLQPLALEADLQLQEARAGAHLLPRTLDTVLVRRCARILDRTDEEVRRRLERTAGE